MGIKIDYSVITAQRERPGGVHVFPSTLRGGGDGT